MLNIDRENFVAANILSQLGGRRFKAMVGVSLAIVVAGGVNIAFKARAANKANRVTVTLDANDTYSVKFIRVHGTTVRTISEHSEIYADRLAALFTEETKLYTSL